MVETSSAYYNKYLRQLQTFPDIDLILQLLIVPTSVVLLWNRISMVLKGADYYAFDWYDVSGCLVNEDSMTLVRHDINHLVMNGTALMPCYSLRNSPENWCWVISKLESDLAVKPEEESEILQEEESTSNLHQVEDSAEAHLPVLKNQNEAIFESSNN